MTARNRLAALLALALSAGPLSAGEAKPPAPPEPPAKAPPAAEAKKDAPKPAPEAKAPEPPAETDAARRERLGKLYEGAEGLYREGRLADAQKLYAQVALEDPSFKRVASRLDSIRAKLQDEEKRARQAQIEQLAATADAQFAAGQVEAAAKSCEAVLALQPGHRRAQQRLAECAGELDLRRRVTSIIAEPADAAGGRQVVAQAPSAAGPGPAAAPAEPAPPAKGGPPVVRSSKDLIPAPPKTTRIVGPDDNREVPQAPLKPAGDEADPDGRRLIKEAWDLAEGAKLAADPRPVLHKALDALAPITLTSKHSERNKQTAALLRRSIMRRLAEGGKALTPEQAQKARLYQRYLEAEELFRQKRFDDCVLATGEILAEDRQFHLARTLNQEARIKAHEDKMVDKDLEHRLAFDRRMAEVEELSVPRDFAPPGQRAPIDLSRPIVRITSPELEEKLNQRVSVNLIEADLDYFLDLLFRSTGVNLIYNPEVVTGKTITVHIANYPLRQLLDYIAKNHALLFTTTQDGVLITTPDQPRLESFVIPLNYGLVDVEEAPPSGAVASQGGASTPLPPPTTSNIEKLITNLPQLCEWPQGSFTYLDRKMNVLFLRTTRDTYAEVVRLLDPVDQIPVQVLIKTLFIEINADEFESAGISLELKNANTTDDFRLLDGKILQFGAESFAETANTNATLRLAGVCDAGEFNVILDAIQRTQKSRTLAAPNVICINNCTATVSVTKSLIYIEDYEVDRSDISGTSYGNPYYQQPVPGQQQQYIPPLSSEPIITPVFAEDEYVGFTLDVCPSVGKDTRYISLTLNPRIREEILPRLKFKMLLPRMNPTVPTTPGTPAATTTSGYEEVEVERPIIAEKALSTKLTAADGSVVILGGLIQQKKTQVRSKVPWLGDLPLIGWLFSNTSYRDSKTNLLIFVQAEIITPTGARYADSGKVDETPPAAPPRNRVEVQERTPPVVQPATLP